LMCTVGQKTRELIALAKNGDKSALNQLYRVYMEGVRWMLRLRMSAVFDGRDLNKNRLLIEMLKYSLAKHKILTATLLLA